MFGKGHRAFAFGLACVLGLSSPFQGIAYGNPSAGYSLYKGEEKTYLAPIEMYFGSWDNIGSENPTTINHVTNQRLQIKDKALITENNGKYTVRMEYASYHAYDMIQIINPDKIDDLKEKVTAEDKTVTALPSVSMGDFNAPDEYIYPTNAAKHIAAGNISSDYNEYYWHDGEVSVSLANETQDTGYITFQTDDLSGEWIVRSYFSRQAGFSSASTPVIIRFSNAIEELPQGLTISEDSTETGYAWTNYVKTTKLNVGNRDDDPAVLTFLNKLFEEKVVVKKDEEGGLKAVLTFRQSILDNYRAENTLSSTVTSVKYVKSRTVDVSTSSLSVNLRQEMVDVTWSDNFLEGDGTVEIPYKDLTDSMLFQISTYELDQANIGQKPLNEKHYYGSLWLSGYEGSQAEGIKGYQSVPVKKYYPLWTNLNNPDAGRLTNAEYYFQNKDNVLISENEDGTYQIRMEYVGYSLYDMIQIVDPDHIDEFKEAANEAFMGNSPLGDFNAPDVYKKISNAQPWIDKGKITAEFNQYYLNEQEVAIEPADEQMDTGYLTWNTDDLAKQYVIRAYSSSIYRSSFSNAYFTAIYEFDTENAVELPETLSVQYDAGEMGYSWTNYAKPESKHDCSRDKNDQAKELLYDLFSYTVAYEKRDDGSIDATFTFKEFDETDPVTLVRIATAKSTNYEEHTMYSLVNESIGNTWVNLLDTDDNTVTINFKDLMDSMVIEVSTKSNDAANEDRREAFQTNYIGTLWLSEEIMTEAGQQILYSTNGNGARVITDTESIPENSTFFCEATETPRYIRALEQVSEAVKAYAKSADAYVMYDYYIRDAQGNEVIPKNYVTIELPIPDTMDAENVLVYWCDSASGYGYSLPRINSKVIGEVVRNSSGNWVLRLVPFNVDLTYFSIAIYDPGTPVEEEEILALDAGFYEVRTTIRNMSGNQPSMANTSIYENRGVLHVKEKGGDYDLYLKLKGVSMAGFGYLSKVRVYNTDESTSELVDVLAYMSTADMQDNEFDHFGHTERSEDNLMIEDLCEDEHIQYLYRIRLPLSERYWKNSKGWRLGFNVPLMNEFTGVDINGEKEATLRILEGSIRPIDGNDLAGYSNSVLMAEINEAAWYLDTMEAGTERDTLEAAIKAAETVYGELKASPDEERLLEAVATLHRVLAEAGGGSEIKKTLSNGAYNIPFKVYDSSSAGSQESSRSVFFDSASIEVGTNTMTVTINTKTDSAGDAITSLRYDNGNRLTEADEVRDADGNVTGYTFTRAYTEDRFELEIYTAAYNYSNMLMLELDFEHAEKLEVTEEDIKELQTLFTELQTLITTDGNEALYTESSYKAAVSAVEALQAILGYMEWEDLEYTTVQTQLKALKEAKKNLVLTADLQGLLTDAIQSGKSYQEKRDKYLSASMEPLDAAVIAAETVLGGFAEAAQADIEKAIRDIETAVEGLKEVNDKTELNSKIAEAVTYYDQADLYTYSTKIALIEAFEEARNVASLENPSLALMEQHIAALNKAILALEFQSREDLASLIISARGYDISLYEEASVKALAAAILSAQDTYDNTELEDREYKDAAANLQSAMDQMVLLPDNTEKLEALGTFVTNLENHLAAVNPEDTYEPSSYASLLASIEAAKDMLNSENGYKLTEEEIDAQMDALEDEYEAMIELADLTGDAAASYSYRKISFDAIDMEEEELEAELDETQAETEEELENDLEITESETTKSETVKETNKETEPETQALQKEEEESKAENVTDGSGQEESEPETVAGNNGEGESEPETGGEGSREESEPETVTENNGEGESEPGTEGESSREESEPEGEVTTSDDGQNANKEDVDEGGETLSLSKSIHQTIRVFAAATPSNAEIKTDTGLSSERKSTLAASSRSVSSLGEILEDGVYAIDYVLWQYAKNAESMGNGAVADAFPDRAGKQARLMIEGDDAYLQIEFQSMEYDNQTGHLLEMAIMDNLMTDSEGVIEDYTAVYPEILEEFEEGDDYGPPAGRKYPKLVEFDITKYVTVKNAYIPVLVNVPVMGSSAEQPAYIRLYWNTFALVEGADPGDSNDPEEAALDFEALDSMVDTVSSVKKADYTTKSYTALTASIEAADALRDLDGVTQDMVDARTDALGSTYKALLIVRTGDSEDDPNDPSEGDNPNQDEEDKITEARDELQLLYLEALSYVNGNYTQSSLTALNTAISAALTVLKNSDATELQINRAVSNLEKVITSLEEAGNADSTTVKKNALSALISTAGSLNSGDYTTSSWLQLTTALTLARITYSDETATQAEVDAQVANLQSAINGLSAASGSDSSSSSSDTDNDDGYYSVSVRLWHSSMNKASMGDDAVNSKAYVHIDDGDVTMRLVTKKMNVSGITAHLHDFWIYIDGEYEEAELISTESSKWIYEFELPNDTSTYYKCQVDPQVDVMGDDPVKARLKVTWSSLKEVDEDDWDDLEGSTDDDDDDDSSSSSTQSAGAELTHADTGIRVQGNTGGPGVVLAVNKLENGTQFDMARSFLAEKASRFVLYDIKLQSGTNYVQPTGAVTLRIPIPAGYDTGKLVLYHIDDTGNAVEISGKVNGSYYEASVSHFSLYSLAESNRAAVAAVSAASTNTRSSGGNASTGTKTAEKTSTKTSVSSLRGDTTPVTTLDVPVGEHVIAGRTIPYTGDTTPVKELMGVGLAALVLCLGTIFSGKHRRKEEEA